MKTSLSSKGQIVLPAAIRKQDNLRPGQRFEIERVRDGEYRLRKTNGPDDFDLVEWLLRCPAKGWFGKLPSESTADI